MASTRVPDTMEQQEVGSAMNGAVRILVVEDDAEQRELLLELLAAAGYRCSGAAGVAAAARALARDDYALVLADFDLHDGTGAELVTLGLVSAARVLYVSGRPASELPKVAAVLRKPLEGPELLRAVARVVGKQAAREPQPEERVAELVLYVAADSAASRRAEHALRTLLAAGSFGAVKLQVVDVSAAPAAADLEDRPWLTPTLVRRAPGPRRWLVGDGVDAWHLAALLEKHDLQGVEP